MAVPMRCFTHQVAHDERRRENRLELLVCLLEPSSGIGQLALQIRNRQWRERLAVQIRPQYDEFPIPLKDPWRIVVASQASATASGSRFITSTILR